jgi:hypothetical protein
MLKLWRISQEVNQGWDTYDSAVVCASTEAEARIMQPSSFGSGWCAPEHVKVELIGKAAKGIGPGVIVASFNAG